MHIIVLIVVGLLAVCEGSTPFECPSCVRTRVGPAEYVYGPSYAPMDNPFFTVEFNGTILGYSANGNTEIISRGDLAAPEIFPKPAPIVITPGDPGLFDECGSWINNVIVDGDIIRGWYHAEMDCHYENNGQTYKNIGYCESYDGGETYVKPNYPHNQVLTGTLPPTEALSVGNADQSVIDGGDGYYYMFFINWDNYGYCVARSPVSEGGTPGSWKKYYQGDWTEPGIGGLSTGILNLKSGTIVQHTSGNLIGISSGPGITMSFGSDPLTWVHLDEPVLFNQHPLMWTRPAPTELIAYPNFVSKSGAAGPLDNEFWLYYTYVQPGEDYTQRYLVRRSVTFSMDDTVSLAPQAGVELSRYVSGERSWATTTLPLPLNENYTYVDSLGYLLTAHYANTVPLYDCYIPSWDDHLLVLDERACSAVGQGLVLLRQLGWVYTSEQPHDIVATQALYRCFNPLINQHTVSLWADCERNGDLEYILGWAMKY